MPNDNPQNSEQPTQEDIEAFERFRDLTIDAWSQTLVTCTRRIRTLEQQVIDLRGDIVALKRIVTNRTRGSFDA